MSPSLTFIPLSDKCVEIRLPSLRVAPVHVRLMRRGVDRLWHVELVCPASDTQFAIPFISRFNCDAPMGVGTEYPTRLQPLDVIDIDGFRLVYIGRHVYARTRSQLSRFVEDKSQKTGSKKILLQAKTIRRKETDWEDVARSLQNDLRKTQYDLSSALRDKRVYSEDLAKADYDLSEFESTRSLADGIMSKVGVVCASV
jgi:hypothetical protein